MSDTPPHWSLRRAGAGERGVVARDAVPAALLVALGWFSIVMAIVHGPYNETGDLPLAGVAAGLWAAEYAPIALRRRAPRTALALTVAAMVGRVVLLAVTGRAAMPPSSGLAAAIISYSVLAHLGGRRSVVAVSAAAVFVVGTLGVRAVAGLPLPYGATLGVAVFAVLIPALVGEVVRTRRAYTVALEDRARRLERERQVRDEQAAREERLRIARELHDAVTHHLTGMVVEAGAAERRAGRDPKAAVAALASLETQGRATLTSLRQLVGVLRDAGNPTLADGAASEAAPSAPSPTMARLPDLIASARAIGMEVDLEVVRARPLPDAVDLAAYRILQESLTNIRRHAATCEATVRIAYAPTTLELTVANVARIGAQHGDGFGLIGMRERADHLGGQLLAGPVGERRWVVRAVLPVPVAEEEAGADLAVAK